jgi:glycosyltransferase involved in cell wall biosynthesis
VDRLIEVLAPLLRTHSVDLRVLGDGGEREKIERTITRLGVRHAVELLGARQDVLPALQASDIYVSAAFVEGFGVSIAEAAAVELPAVAFAVPGGLSELIVDRATGYLVDENDPQAYREAVERLCGDVGLRRRMGDAARRHVMEHFSLSQVAEALEACFHAP